MLRMIFYYLENCISKFFGDVIMEHLYRRTDKNFTWLSDLFIIGKSVSYSRVPSESLIHSPCVTVPAPDRTNPLDGIPCVVSPLYFCFIHYNSLDRGRRKEETPALIRGIWRDKREGQDHENLAQVSDSLICIMLDLCRPILQIRFLSRV